MRKFCFTVDDNIRVFKEINEGQFASIFDHPYLAMYRRLHEKHGLCVQLNLFYRWGEFDLSQMTDRYREEWRQNADWLKLSFHSQLENVRPYEHSGYDEVFADCGDVQREILRFATPENLGKTTTVHYCEATEEGLRALADQGVKGLLGLYSNTRHSYQNSPEDCRRMMDGEMVLDSGMVYAAIDIVLNNFRKAEILEQLQNLVGRKQIRVMIHEQFFYPDYSRHQSDFEQKLDATFTFLRENGYESDFFESWLSEARA